LHDVLSFELLAIAAAIMAIVGYLRASALHQNETLDQQQGGAEEAEDAAMLSSAAYQNSDAELQDSRGNLQGPETRSKTDSGLILVI
jgi:hypothetical protein